MNQNVLDTLIFFEITFWRITLMWYDAQVGEPLGLDKKKRG